MRYCLFIFLTLAFSAASGQKKKVHPVKNTDDPVHIWKVYDSLKAKGATSIISVERSFYGMRVLDSLGGPDLYFDVFWQQKGITYFQEIKYYIDRVIRNPVKEISNSNLFAALETDFDSIRYEEILPFIMKSEKNGISSYSELQHIHKTYYDIVILARNEQLSKSFQASYLQEDFGADIPNLNYQYNNSTRLMQLWKQLWEVIKTE